MKSRNKKCENCLYFFIDDSKRNMSRTCSKKCSYELGVKIRKEKGSYKRTFEQNKKLSKTLKQKYKNGWNPNTPDVIKKFIERTKKMNESGELKRKVEATCLKKYGDVHFMKTPFYKQMFSEMFSNRKYSQETRNKMSISAQKRLRTKKESLYTSANGGFRKDLGMYFRSGWEANYARLLKFQNKIWEYEPISFNLKINGSYTPDFKVGDDFFEIKGKVEKSFEKKLKEFKEIYPHINLYIIYEKEYRQLSRMYKKTILNWEGK